MENKDRLEILRNKLYNIEYHIEGFLTEVNTEYFQEDLYSEYLIQKEVILNEISSLTNEL